VAQFRALRAALRGTDLAMREDGACDRKFAELRAMYEPFLAALAHDFLFTLPPILPE